MQIFACDLLENASREAAHTTENMYVNVIAVAVWLE